MKIKEKLFELSDEKYKKFHSGICPGIKNIIGVRVPVLREYAKKLAKENDIQVLLKQIDDEYYEEIMLQGIIIGLSKQNVNEIKIYMEEFIPKIDNWAVCDVFCSGLKITRKYKKEVWAFLQKYLESNKEFEIRFAIVMIINYFIEAEYLSEDFKIFDSITSTEYYVQMAVAWAISVCLVKFYDETIKYLENCKLDNFTYNKAIQKALESYRLSDDQKEVLRSKKRK